MNQKIQCLIDGGFISINDVLEHAGYLENQMNEYYDDVEERRLIDEMYTQEDMYSELVNDDYVMPESIRSSEPEYIIASTAYYIEETYVFEANEQGEITNLSEYGGIAFRFGDIDWTNKALAVETTFGEGKYEFVKEIDRVAKADHHLFKRIYEEPEYPLPSDTYDGGISDEK